MIAVLLPVLVALIVTGGGIAAQLSWPIPPGRHRMPHYEGKHRNA